MQDNDAMQEKAATTELHTVKGGLPARPRSEYDGSYGPFPVVVVATTDEGTQPRFPDLIKLHDGRLLAVYQQASGHVADNGVLRIVSSDDQGQTWSAPAPIVDVPYDARDPKIVQLQDGTVIVSYFMTQWIDGVGNVHGTFTVRSTDGGATWEDPVPVQSRMRPKGAFPNTAEYPGFNASHGPIVQLPDGDLLIPLYGKEEGDVWCSATAVRSTDGGRSWDPSDEGLIGRSDDFDFHEPNLTVLPDGSIVAQSRCTSSPRRAWMSRSTDGGRTFSTPEASEFPASSHHQLLLEDGRLLFTYGDIERPGRPTYGVLIEDPAQPWTGYVENAVALYDAGHGDQGNPSSAELEPGHFITLGYDVVKAELHAVFTSASDYPARVTA